MQIAKGAFYAGIGSRETPDDILVLMHKIAFHMVGMGMILRSGGADGADLAFQQGCAEAGGTMEIFIPWNGFNNYSHNHHSAILVSNTATLLRAEQIARETHPAFQALTVGARKLMIRNTYQVLGGNLSRYSSFLICWTKDGADGTIIKTSAATGGTGQAIRLAVKFSSAQLPILVRNLGDKSVREKWMRWVETKEKELTKS